MVQFYSSQRAAPTQAETIRRDYQNDPRNALAQAMMSEGISTAPIQSHWQGLNRIAQAALGGYMMNKQREDMKTALEQDKTQRMEAQKAMAAALAGYDPSQRQVMTPPDGFGGPSPSVQASPYAGAISAMQGMEGNPYAAEQASQLGMMNFDWQRQQEADRLAKSDAARMLADERAYNERQKQAEREFTRERDILSRDAADIRAKEAAQQRLDFFKEQEKAADRRAAEGRAFELSKMQTKTNLETAKTTKENQKAFNTFDVGMKNVLGALSATETGPIVGRLPAFTAEAQTAEGAVSTMAPVLKSMFRTAGEGTFTDKDQELLLNMIPTRLDEPQARDEKIRMIYDIIRSKLGQNEPMQEKEQVNSNQQNIDDLLNLYGG